jgi:hypothetical protein
MSKISDIGKPSQAQVSVPKSARSDLQKLTKPTGSGCIAALEAEKWLADQDDSVTNELENENQAEKSQVNGVVPEYRSNPLL